MKNKLFNLAVKATAVSMVVSMFAQAMPVSAALATSRSVTLSRHKAATTTDAVVTFTSQETITGDDTTPPTLQIDFANTAGTWTGIDLMDNGDIQVKVGATIQTEDADGTCDGGDAGQVGYAFVDGDTLRVDFCAGSTAVSASTVLEVTIGTVNQLTTPSAGTTTVSLSCVDVCAVTGDMKSAIISDDQVQVTANISQTMVFDVGVNAACSGAAGGGGTVALGSLSPASVSTGSNHICLWLETNADGGAVIQVKDLNNGLASTSPAYTISSGTATLSAGTEGYGLCLESTAADSGSFTAAGSFSGITCASDEVVGVSTAFLDIVNTGGNPIDGTSYESVDLSVSAAVSSTTPASTSYADTLTFRATATF